MLWHQPCKPDILIADKPTNALDVIIQVEIISLSKDIKEEGQRSILIVTHNLGSVLDFPEIEVHNSLTKIQ